MKCNGTFCFSVEKIDVFISKVTVDISVVFFVFLKASSRFASVLGAHFTEGCGVFFDAVLVFASVQVTQLLGWKQRQQLIFHLRQRLHGETRRYAPKVLLGWSSALGVSKRP